MYLIIDQFNERIKIFYSHFNSDSVLFDKFVDIFLKRFYKIFRYDGLWKKYAD